MNTNQKEVVLLPYPFSDLRQEKVRPALVVSNDFFNKKSDDCIMVPLTSVIKEEPYSVLINQKDMKNGKLLKPSRIRTDKIFAVEKSLAVMRIGTLTDEAFKKVRQEIFEMF